MGRCLTTRVHVWKSARKVPGRAFAPVQIVALATVLAAGCIPDEMPQRSPGSAPMAATNRANACASFGLSPQA